jgi:hypothetical protein
MNREDIIRMAQEAQMPFYWRTGEITYLDKLERFAALVATNDTSQERVDKTSESVHEPVAWLITDEKINSIQVDSIQRLIDRARHAHMTDIKLRINGQDEWYQADWLKHLTRTTPPQRTWVGLTDEDMDFLFPHGKSVWVQETVKIIEAKLKEKNT